MCEVEKYETYLEGFWALKVKKSEAAVDISSIRGVHTDEGALSWSEYFSSHPRQSSIELCRHDSFVIASWTTSFRRVLSLDWFDTLSRVAVFDALSKKAPTSAFCAFGRMNPQSSSSAVGRFSSDKIFKVVTITLEFLCFRREGWAKHCQPRWDKISWVFRCWKWSSCKVFLCSKRRKWRIFNSNRSISFGFIQSNLGIVPVVRLLLDEWRGKTSEQSITSVKSSSYEPKRVISS